MCKDGKTMCKQRHKFTRELDLKASKQWTMPRNDDCISMN